MKKYINEVRVGDICEQHYNMAALTGLGWSESQNSKASREKQIYSFSFNVLFGHPQKTKEKKQTFFDKLKTNEGFDFMLGWAKTSDERSHRPMSIFTSKMILASAENNKVFSVNSIERKFHETLIVKNISFSPDERNKRICEFIVLQEARDIYKYKNTLKEYTESNPPEKTDWENTDNFMEFIIYFNNKFIDNVSKSLNSFSEHTVNIIETEGSKVLLGSLSVVRFDTDMPFIEESLKKVLTRLEIEQFKEQLKETVYTPLSKSEFIIVTPPGAEELNELLIKRKENLLKAANDVVILSSERIVYHKSNEGAILDLVQELKEHPDLISYYELKAEQTKEFDFMEKMMQSCKNKYDLKAPEIRKPLDSVGSYKTDSRPSPR